MTTDSNDPEEWQARGYLMQFNRADCPKCNHGGPHHRLSEEQFKCWQCGGLFDPMRWEGADQQPEGETAEDVFEAMRGSRMRANAAVMGEEDESHEDDL